MSGSQFYIETYRLKKMPMTENICMVWPCISFFHLTALSCSSKTLPIRAQIVRKERA